MIPDAQKYRRRASPILPAVVSVIALLLPVVSPDPASAGAAPSPVAGRQLAVAEVGYRAEIRRTTYGIPHIRAASLGSVAFGQGWAYAQDRLCDLADQVVKVRGERARWLGPGPEDQYLASDFGYRALRLVDQARQALPTLSSRARSMLEGYAAGYNRYLATVGPGGVHGWCAGQPWIAPITAVDLLAYEQDLAIASSGRAMLPAIAVAQPPAVHRSDPRHTRGLRVPPAVVADSVRRALRESPGSGPGSNGWAIGGDRSSTGRGALLANPHFPWQGELQLWECQLTVPGELNVYGSGVGGLPGVQIGFNEKVAWTHTVAPGARYTFAKLQLLAGDRTSYRSGDRVLHLRPTTLSIQVKLADSRLGAVTRTLWSTDYGPIVDLSSLDPGDGWSTTSAIAFRDANAGNTRELDFWLAMAQSGSVAEVAAANARYGTPWLNTLAADRSGDTWYGDPASTPDLGKAATEAWLASPIGLLDGSDPRQDWLESPGAAAPGLLPPNRWPQLTRRDYVFNANNSPWIANPQHPLEGFSALLGEQRTALDARARFNALQLADSGQGPDHRFDPGELVSAVLSDETLSSRLLLGPVRKLCRAHVGEAKACHVLGNWDGRFSADSRGAVLWREVMSNVLAADRDALVSAGPLLSKAFDPRDPVHTPGTPKPDPAVLGPAITDAQHKLEAAGFPLDVSLGSVQYENKGGKRLPMPGTVDALGGLNVVEYTPDPGTTTEPVQPSDGFQVNTGTSMLLAVQFTQHGPVAKGLLTFSESIDPGSPHFADQQGLFAQGRVRNCLFTWPDILADPALDTTVVTGR
ncbi:penicillin acylase family protein [Streptomyces pinistramenti]|uniref:penicillin acylase family protein n=1 Tax=Streptomyces pinistramenti TaxID=2884812 RepID=UPI001D08427C|nr:penicillin acylase family protein [Streptomyces pinistramenti]MCB5909713.1 penicillin acylase family protein [Streptomyces pinistramenti]